jgi:hypothetical protein
MLPVIFNELKKTLFVYDIYNEKIENPDQFDICHKKIIRSKWKRIVPYVMSANEEDKNNAQESNKKRIDKEYKLYIKKRTSEISHLLIDPVWEPLQYNLFLNIINFYKQNQNIKL